MIRQSCRGRPRLWLLALLGLIATLGLVQTFGNQAEAHLTPSRDYHAGPGHCTLHEGWAGSGGDYKQFNWYRCRDATIYREVIEVVDRGLFESEANQSIFEADVFWRGLAAEGAIAFGGDCWNVPENEAGNLIECESRRGEPGRILAQWLADGNKINKQVEQAGVAMLCVYRSFLTEAVVVGNYGPIGIYNYVPPTGADAARNPGYYPFVDRSNPSGYTDCNNGLEDLSLTQVCVEGPFWAAEEEGGNCYFFARPRAENELVTEPGNEDDEDTADPGTPYDEESPFDQGVIEEEVSATTSNLIGADPCSDDTQLGLNWLFCHVLEAVSSGVEKIEEQIYELLRVEREDYQGEKCDSPAGRTGACSYRDVWASIRNLTTLAIVGTALLMVIATALDFGWFSNYTVKKYLARLIAGVVLVQLSWAVGDFVITLANQLGGFIGGVITAPFAGNETVIINGETVGGATSFTHNYTDGRPPTTSTLNPAESIGLADIFHGWAATAAGVTVIGAGIVVGIMALGGAFSLVGVLFTVLIGFLMFLAGFMFLVLRQFIIVFLLAFAPIGIAFWFLPGSDKFWKIYYRTFISLVMIYPIIVAVIAFGRSFIWVLLRSNHNGWNEPIIILVAFLVYVGMFAAIPFLFKRFLGAVNQLTGTSNNPAKGLIDRMRNARKGYMDRNKAFRRGMQDRRDEKTLEAHKDAPGLSWGGMRRGAIQAKRSFRYGLPLHGVRGDVQDMIAQQRQVERAKRTAEEEKAAMQSIELDYGNDNGAIAQLAGGIDPHTGQAVTPIFQEAAIKLLVGRKQYDILARLQGQAGGSAKLSQALANLSARDAGVYREMQEVASGAAQAKTRKDQIEALSRSVGGQYGFSDSEHDRLVQYIAGTDPAASSTVEVEAAIEVLAKRKRSKHVRMVGALGQGKQGNPAIRRAYSKVERDGTLFDNFNETDYPLARGQVGAANFADATDDQLATQDEPALADMSTWLNNLRQSGNMAEARTFVERVDRVVNNQYKRQSMLPVTINRLTGMRNQHVALESRTRAANLRRPVQELARSINSRSEDNDNNKTLEADIDRQSAMRAMIMSDESGRNREIRRLCRSTSRIASDSFNQLLAAEGFDVSDGTQNIAGRNLDPSQLAGMTPIAARVIQAQVSGNETRQQLRDDNNLRAQVQTAVQAAAANPNTDPGTATILQEIDQGIGRL